MERKGDKRATKRETKLRKRTAGSFKNRVSVKQENIKFVDVAVCVLCVCADLRHGGNIHAMVIMICPGNACK